MTLPITDRFPEVIRQLADPALRAIVLALAALTLRLLRVKNTSAELAVWNAVLYAALALPLLGRLLPALPVHVPLGRAMVAVKALETNWLSRNWLMEPLRLARTARALGTAQALPTDGVGTAAHSHSGPLAGVYSESSAPTSKCSRTRDLDAVGCLTYVFCLPRSSKPSVFANSC